MAKDRPLPMEGWADQGLNTLVPANSTIAFAGRFSITIGGKLPGKVA